MHRSWPLASWSVTVVATITSVALVAPGTLAGDQTPSAAVETVSTAAGFRPFRFRLGVHGFVAATSVDSDGVQEDEVDFTFLRPEIRWEPSEAIRGVFEMDFAGDPRITDAFVRVRSERVGVRVGQFKPPFSTLEMASRWEIPTADRGLLSEVLVDAMGWAGRRPGIEAQLRKNGHFDLDVRLGLFRASHTRGDRIGDEGFDNLRKGYSFDSQSLIGRVEIARKRGSLGFSGEWRPAEPVPGEGSSRFWGVGVDFAWASRKKAGGLRAWVEGFCGSSWQDSNAFDGTSTTFVAGRTVLAWRFKGEQKGRLFFEPYARASIADPDTSMASDLVNEVTGGLNAGLWERLRVNLEVQHQQFSRNVPSSLGLEPLAAASPKSRTALIVQVGGGF